ncbi:MAG: hypothetical protein ACOYON_04265 [Fimbriimonas sp.]
MQPPPFNSAPKKKNNAVVIVMVVGALGLCCVGPVILLGVGGYFGAKVMKSSVDCAVSLAFVNEAVTKYAADKGTLPNAATWQDDIKPYYAKLMADPDNSTGPITAFKTDEVWVCVDTEGGKTGVAFNKDLSKKKLAHIKDKSTVVIFETEQTGSNLTESYKPKAKDKAPKIFGNPREWITIPVDGELMMGKGAKFDIK